jgi:excisionase family DNA binding protein
MPTPKPDHEGSQHPHAELFGLLTIPQSAAYLGVSTKTVYQEMRAGNLAAVRMGPRRGAVRVARAELDRYISEAQAWEPAS